MKLYVDQIKEAEELLKTSGLSPHDLAELKTKLAAEYSSYAGLLEMILSRKPSLWNAMRKNHQSDKACEREYESTTDGIDEMSLRLRMKRCEKLMGSISSSLKVAEGQAKNLY